MYSIIDAAVARLSTRRPQDGPRDLPDFTASADELIPDCRRWLREVWACEEFTAALRLASPTLAGRIGQICEGQPVPDRDLLRAAHSAARYHLRSAGRATPFGLFSGVTTLRFGARPHLRLGQDHQGALRIDAEWLNQVITQLEATPELFGRLLIVRNNLAFIRDGRLAIGCHPAPGPDTAEPAEVSVRLTKPVHVVYEAAATPRPHAELVELLAAEFPGQPAARIHTLLHSLVVRGLLITNLRAPTSTPDPLGYLVDTLAAIDSPTVTDTVAVLQDIHHETIRHRTTHLEQSHALRTATATRMRTLVDSENPLAVDLHFDGDLVLPEVIAREAETAAAVLTRLAPHPAGTPGWRDYHHRFCERYGLGALVPVQDLVDRDSGLGYPAGYRDSHLTAPTRAITTRDVELLAVAQQAALHRQREVVLDEQAVARLAVQDDAPTSVRPHVELRCRIHAASIDALQRGDFQLAVTGVSRAAGTVTGRFLDLLSLDDRQRMVHAYAAMPTHCADADLVQVSGPPTYQRTQNVARSGAVLPGVIAIGEWPAPAVTDVDLADLAVTADSNRLYLISISTGRVVEATVLNAVEFTNHTHPLIRFLCEISTAQAPGGVPFSWGAAGDLPFLPRIRYDRSILSPATWTVAASDIAPRTTPDSNWNDDFATWRDRNLIPNTVFAGDGDQRLRLDLDEPRHVALLRAELERHGRTTLREAPSTGELGWIDDRAHDLVIPLQATTPPVTADRPRSRHLLDHQHGHQPGQGEWLYLKLYTPRTRQTDLLRGHLPDLLSTLEPEPLWWVLRYRDPEHHLRLRLRIPAQTDFADITHHVAQWTARLRHLGLISNVQWDTYLPETGRYGSGASMAAAEELFGADSIAATTQLRAATRNAGVPSQALTALSMIDLVHSAFPDTRTAMTWLITHVDNASTPSLRRDLRTDTIRLADPDSNWSELHARTGNNDLPDAWSQRRSRLVAYKASLQDQPISFDQVLKDLLHLHHARVHGIDPDHEKTCRRLARAAALSWTARNREPR